MKNIFLLIGCLIGPIISYAQLNSLNTSVFDDEFYLGSTDKYIVSEDSLIIGSDAVLKIDGVVEVYSTYIWISPLAQMEGKGKIKIYNPKNNPNNSTFKDSPNYIDGNGNLNFNVALDLFNENNLVLAEIVNHYLPDLNSKVNDFYTDANVSLAVDGACIDLNGSSMILGEFSNFSNFSKNRMIITGNKEGSRFSKVISGKSTFIFPIGIFEGDYHPITLTPDYRSQFFTSIFKEDGALNLPKVDRMINRIWFVHADHNVRANYDFCYNGTMSSSTASVFQFDENKKWKKLESQNLNANFSTRLLSSMYSDSDKNYFTLVAEKNSNALEIDESISVNEGDSVLIPIPENDIKNIGHIIKGKIEIIDKPRNGFLDWSLADKIKYIPLRDYVGDDHFSFQYIDEAGELVKKNISINIKSDRLFVQNNVVTPNNDGYNDRFKIFSADKLIELDLTVVNRLGKEVYRNKSYDNSWTAQDLDEGTYYYTIRAKRGNGASLILRGWVLVMK